MFCIDPGHGGTNIGAMDGYENKINLDIALRFEHLCQALGFPTKMTRRSETTVHPKERKDICVGSSSVISIHHNASPRETEHGMRLFYWPSNKTAMYICNAAQSYAHPRLRSPTMVVPASEPYPGARGVCGLHDQTTVLVECGFLTNPADLAFIQSDLYVDHMAVFLLQLALHFIG